MSREKWHVYPSSKAEKLIERIPDAVRSIVFSLFQDLENIGPKQPGWPHYSALGKHGKKIPKNSYHCHLKRGKPTYVACWQVVDEKKKIIEVFYVGSHENAPY